MLREGFLCIINPQIASVAKNIKPLRGYENTVRLPKNSSVLKGIPGLVKKYTTLKYSVLARYDSIGEVIVMLKEKKRKEKNSCYYELLLTKLSCIEGIPGLVKK
jgi:hypothetical protein